MLLPKRRRSHDLYLKKLYFILETKGSTSGMDLRLREQLKIQCGIRHFAALADSVEMHKARNWKEFKNGI